MGALGRIELMQPADLEQGAARYNMYEHALQAVASRGLVMPTQPQQSFQMPETITRMDDNALGDLLSMASRWCGYIESELAQMKTLRDQAESQLEFIRARVRIGVKMQTEQKLTNPDKDDLVTTDPRVVEAEAALLFHQAKYEYTKVLLNNAQRDWDTVSRRITQRGQEVDRMKREGNVGNVPIRSGTFMR